MCAASATSHEHVPPRCVFPATKDMTDRASNRASLITVPACTDHNLSKSKDDEYLMLVLPAHYRTNIVARQQMRSKVKRALNRRPELKQRAYAPQMPGLLDGKETGVFQLDLERFHRILDWMVRGLHFHHTSGVKLQVPLEIYPLSTDSFDSATQRRHNDVRRFSAALFDGRLKLGANPDVFFYQVAVKESRDAAMLKLTFYGGFEVLATWGKPDPLFVAP
jgi:hypothetical protein